MTKHLQITLNLDIYKYIYKFNLLHDTLTQKKSCDPFLNKFLDTIRKLFTVGRINKRSFEIEFSFVFYANKNKSIFQVI